MVDYQFKLRNTFHILLIGVGLSYVAFGRSDVNSNSWLRNWTIGGVGSLQAGVMNFRSSLVGWVNNYVALIDVKQENEVLHRQLEKLKSDLRSLKEVNQEVERTRVLENHAQNLTGKYKTARVIYLSNPIKREKFRINLGRSDGIEVYSPVFVAKGMVGFVESVQDRFSDVITLISPSFRLDAIVGPGRYQGVLEGSVGNTCRLKYLGRTDQVSPGDEVISSGLDGIAPKGILIGRVSKVSKKEYGITQKVEVEPSVNLRKIEEVLVGVKR